MPYVNRRKVVKRSFFERLFSLSWFTGHKIVMVREWTDSKPRQLEFKSKELPPLDMDVEALSDKTYHDSSFDLMTGLLVVEHVKTEPVPLE